MPRVGAEYYRMAIATADSKSRRPRITGERRRYRELEPSESAQWKPVAERPPISIQCASRGDSGLPQVDCPSPERRGNTWATGSLFWPLRDQSAMEIRSSYLPTTTYFNRYHFCARGRVTGKQTEAGIFSGGNIVITSR